MRGKRAVDRQAGVKPPVFSRWGLISVPVALLAMDIMLSSKGYEPGVNGKPVPGTVEHLPPVLAYAVGIAGVLIALPRLRRRVFTLGRGTARVGVVAGKTTVVGLGMVAALVAVAIVGLTALSISWIVADFLVSVHAIAPFMHKHAFIESLTKLVITVGGTIGLMVGFFTFDPYITPQMRLAIKQEKADARRMGKL